MSNFGSDWVLHTMVAGLLIMLGLSLLPLRPAPGVAGAGQASPEGSLQSASVRRFLLITALLGQPRGLQLASAPSTGRPRATAAP